MTYLELAAMRRVDKEYVQCLLEGGYDYHEDYTGKY